MVLSVVGNLNGPNYNFLSINSVNENTGKNNGDHHNIDFNLASLIAELYI